MAWQHWGRGAPRFRAACERVCQSRELAFATEGTRCRRGGVHSRARVLAIPACQSEPPPCRRAARLCASRSR
eukprot:1309089-Alexandrium_andersonii.AAC.1